MKPQIGDKIIVGLKSAMNYSEKQRVASMAGKLDKHGKEEVRTVKAIYSDGTVMDNCNEPWKVKKGDKRKTWVAVK